MGNHRHTKDHVYIIYRAQNGQFKQWGGKIDPEKVSMSKLPFFCCNLSLTPFKIPVCSPDGIVFDIVIQPETSNLQILLCEKGYYNGVKFHRLVKDFMNQGGDPTGTGRGEESIFGQKFEDEFHVQIRHDKPGILRMANSGPNTNSSQFISENNIDLKNISFITLGTCNWLDEQHISFGEVIGNQLALHKINQLNVKGDQPESNVVIEKVIISENPFRIVIVRIQEQKREKIKAEKRQQQEKEREHERWISNNDKFILPTHIELEEKPQIKSVGLAGLLTDPKISNYYILPKDKHIKIFNFSDW